ncbi:aldehyde dehydrogenase family protein [Phytohabitans sp. ZYX-F-186]|uniref:Aldehyde dehydrogenase family protein n=1 Tax=Phytohabitans maris TaxID=3071409 RepID=A0ABU0Z9K7_9ACTN|nr:aldehyde dehydrogenase family protein [Phytohabitans sp. ZYX-F-186]MDQ7903724.1 aldehyde dehydrogenase family protein [Phytohabitans sp. ZYX-F-186]
MTVVEAPSRVLVGGERYATAGTYPIVNPATEDVVAEAPDAGPADVAAAVEAAKAAFPAWSQTSREERSRLLHRAADIVESRADELGALIQAETGALMHVARWFQVTGTVGRLRRYARGALEVRDVPLAPHAMPSTVLGPGALLGGNVLRRPVGVVACVTPYNWPMGGMAGKVGPALATGNTVVVKPAPQDPLACLALGEILVEAGFPPGVVNVLTSAGPETGAALVDSPDVDMVSFTGSTAVGMKIAEAGGRTLKRLFLELGGKGAAIVLPDADIPTAVTGISATWTFQSGQGCILPTRAVVHRSIYDALVEALAERANSLKVGDPLDADTVVGPVISAAQRERIESLTQSARDEGARIAAGGTRPGLPRGFYAAPTLVADAHPGMTIAQREVFGPVVTAIPYDTVEEAVEITNGTEYGLHNYVFGKDVGKAYDLAAQLRSGYVSLNNSLQHPEAPFGGFKRSGLGRDGGSFALDAYTEMQSVVWT